MFNISTDEIEIHNICFTFFYKLYLYYSSKPLVKYIINCFIRGSPCIANYCIGQFYSIMGFFVQFCLIFYSEICHLSFIK